MDGPRHRLASLEAEFLRSLSTGGPYSSNSDLRGMRATSQILWTKRVRTMARAWPELAQLLGKSLNEHATELLAGTPLPPGDHAVEDGLMLARHLEGAGSIPDGVGLRMLSVKLRYRWQRGHLVRRSRPAAGCVYLRRSRRLICAVRVGGRRLLSISVSTFPLPRPRGTMGAG
jgi:hypothetical protein